MRFKLSKKRTCSCVSNITEIEIGIKLELGSHCAIKRSITACAYLKPVHISEISRAQEKEEASFSCAYLT